MIPCRWTPRGGAALALLAGAAGAGWGCARAAAPPGGPPDVIPPFVVEVLPDTFALPEERVERVTIRFSERISERPSTGSWVDAVTVSPESGEVRVRHRRDALEVEVEEGFREGRVYRVSLAPVVRDLFQNTMLDPFELVFSTGPAFEPTVLAGLVWDRITGEPLRDHRVEAASGDSTADRHVARSDSAGIFALRYVPSGAYRVVAFPDRNRNRILDAGEPRGSTSATLAAGDTVVTMLSVLAPDTTPAAVTRVELADSVTIRVVTDDALDPEVPLDGVRWRLLRAADSVEVPIIRGAYHPAGLEALREADREAAGLPAEEEEPPPTPRAAAGRGARTTTPDGRPLPAREFFLPLSIPLVRGEPHVLEVEGIVNLHGIPGGSGRGTLERPPLADSAAVPDSTALPDTVPADPVPPLLLGVRSPGAGAPGGRLRPRAVRP